MVSLDAGLARGDDGAERLALDELHHQDEADLGVGDEVDDAGDVVAADAPEEVGLALEARHDLRIARGGGEQRLQRHAHPERGLLAGPDLAHAAGADLALHTEAAGDQGSRP